MERIYWVRYNIGGLFRPIQQAKVTTSTLLGMFRNDKIFIVEVKLIKVDWQLLGQGMIKTKPE